MNITSVFDRDTLLHLRLPFSFFLLPVFWFGLSQAGYIHLTDTLIVFIALHLLIYPGSNIYNSYMDKDTGSIGGLRHPPPVTPKLYYASIVCDTAGLLLCSISGWRNALVMAGYVAFSKAYSWHGTRLKKSTYLGWFMVMFFQGGYTFMLANMAAEDQVSLTWFTTRNVLCMFIASLLIGGYYPLTQIYQHEEDASRGDYTISYRLGVRGTFIFSGLLFLAGTVTAFFYFRNYYSLDHFLVFAGCNLPAIIYFLYWAFKAGRDVSFADYTHSMRMTQISSVCMVVCFSILMAWNQGW